MTLRDLHLFQLLFARSHYAQEKHSQFTNYSTEWVIVTLIKRMCSTNEDNEREVIMDGTLDAHSMKSMYMSL